MEEAERYWFAFVLYTVRRLSERKAEDEQKGSDENEFTLGQILRVTELKYVICGPFILASPKSLLCHFLGWCNFCLS